MNKKNFIYIVIIAVILVVIVIFAFLNKNESSEESELANTDTSNDLAEDKTSSEEDEYINADEKYGWVNESTDGLEEISEEEATQIALQYAKELVESDSYMGQYLDNYTKVYEVEKIAWRPNNYWLITDGIIESQMEVASFERETYDVTLVAEDDDLGAMRAHFYVDIYTGKVIGGREEGE